MTLLSMTRGDKRVFTVTLTDAAGAPLDLTNLTLTFTAKAAFADIDADAVLSKTTGAGIVSTAPLTGVALITIDPDDTEALENPPTLVWDLQVEDATGLDVRTPLSGKLIIAYDVTRSLPVVP